MCIASSCSSRIPRDALSSDSECSPSIFLRDRDFIARRRRSWRAYTLSDGRLARVALRDDLITVSIPGAFNAGAFPISRDEFYAPFFENTVRFERNADGAGHNISIRFFGDTWKGERRPP
jgi:hypothetical protein